MKFVFICYKWYQGKIPLEISPLWETIPCGNNPLRKKLPQNKSLYLKFFQFKFFVSDLSGFLVVLLVVGKWRVEGKNKFYSKSFTLQLVRVNVTIGYLVYVLGIYLGIYDKTLSGRY